MTAEPLPDVSPHELDFGSATDPGRKRVGEPNQDAFLIVPAEEPRPALIIVADGMGGHAGGALASKMVVEAIAIHYRGAADYQNLPVLFGECLQRAHNALKDYAARHAELASMGSTAVLAVMQGDQVFVANVGDSRAYLVHTRQAKADIPTQEIPSSKGPSFLARLFKRRKRASADKATDVPGPSLALQSISYDHSVVADQIRAGLLTPLQARRSPKRNRLTQSITPRRPDLAPYFAQFPFSPGDALLLCTDGLWGVLTEATIQAIVQELPPQAAADKLVSMTLASGAPDNVTLVIARKGGALASAADEDDETDPGL